MSVYKSGAKQPHCNPANPRLYLLALLLTILGILTVFLVLTYRQSIDRLNSSIANEARILSSRLETSLRRVEASSMLFTMKLQAAADLPERLERFSSVRADLTVLAGSFPDILGHFFFDSSGRCLSDPEDGLDLGPWLSSPWLASFLAEPRPGLFFSDSLVNPADGQRLLLAYQAVFDGAVVGLDNLAGLVVTPLNLEYYESIFAELRVGQQGMISVRRSDTSQLVVRWPVFVAELNNLASAIPPQQAIAAGTQRGVVRYIGRTDAVDRFFAYDKLDGYPFYILFGRAYREYMASWRHAVWLSSLIALGAFGLLGYLLYRLTASDRRLVRNEQRYMAIVEHQRDLICRWQPDTSLSFVNSAFERLLAEAGQHRVLGRPWRQLMEPVADDRQEAVAVEGQAHEEMVTRRAIRLADGSLRIIEWVDVPILSPEGRLQEYQSVGRDITDRQRVEAELKANLAEKDILLRELYHRTKNNMQVIRSMLMLKAVASDDPKIERFASEMEGQIMAMALVQQKLYLSKDLSQLDLGDYLAEVVGLVLRSAAGMGKSPKLELKLSHQAVQIDTAMPCGLILNELVLNSLRHAFPDSRQGTIGLRLERLSPHELELCYWDDGVGLPPGFDYRVHGNMGMQTLVQLAEFQLEGTLSLESGPGLRWRLRFPSDLYSSRV